MQRKWYKGDTHLHTTNSDGSLSPKALIARCKKKGLEYIIITDHNFNTVEQSHREGDLCVIQGQELTGEGGHVNVWGAKVPFDAPYDLSDLTAYQTMTAAAKKDGAVISVNHPFCTNCPFQMDMDAFEMDCVEVWNTIQHSDNMKNMRWWTQQLLQGRKIAAVGGSDFHKNYLGLDLLAMPTTVVHAKSNAPQDILNALREGRSVVTNQPEKTMLFLSVGEASVGDTAALTEGLKGKCTATKLRRGHTLKIYNNDMLVYAYTAKRREKEHVASFDITQKGFVRAEVDYDLSPLLKALVSFAEKKFLASRGKTPPATADTFFWAFTNPIWIA